MTEKEQALAYLGRDPVLNISMTEPLRLGRAHVAARSSRGVVLEMDGIAMVTADHGNADRMTDEEGKPFTAHTTNPVPFIAVGFPEGTKLMPEGGRLADIAPTMLQALGLPQPPEMTGRSMLE